MKCHYLSSSRVLLLVLGVVVLHASGCAHIGQPAQAEVAGRTFVVTGASSGFGRGVALKLGAMHANVVLAARRTELLEEVAALTISAGGKALVVTTDVSQPDQMEQLAAKALERFGSIDVWINNAGVGAIGRFEDIPMVDHSRLIDINLKGVIYGSHVAMRQFRRQGYGSLVNVGSIDSEVPLAYQASYSASKAGVLSLGRALNEEIRLVGLQNRLSVSTIMPWAADTPWWAHAANYSGGTPRMAAMDDPQKVVDAVIWVSLHPQEEAPAGWKANASYASHRLFPDVTEHMSADIAHEYQIKTAPPAEPTSGTLYEPMQSGRDVEGGVRLRMRQEDKARRNNSVD